MVKEVAGQTFYAVGSLPLLKRWGHKLAKLGKMIALICMIRTWISRVSTCSEPAGGQVPERLAASESKHFT